MRIQQVLIVLINLLQELMFKKRQIKTQVINLDDSNLMDPESSLKCPEVKKMVKFDSMKGNALGGSTSIQKQVIEKQAQEELDELNYKGTNAIHNQEDLAVMGNQIDTEADKDARTKAVQSIEITKKIKDGTLQKGVYRGMNGYANYTLNEQIAQNSKFKGNFGPLRAPTNIRVTSRMDHNPELCKDWFVSGYCVFGNSCIYIHDRYDYKSGFQLDKDFQRQERQRWRRINDPTYQQKPEYQDKLEQFKVDDECKSCQTTYQSPKTVSCGHIFCRKCALKLNKCVICKKKLTGIMNNAQKQLQTKKVLYEQMKTNFENEAKDKKLERKKWRDENELKMFQK